MTIFSPVHMTVARHLLEEAAIRGLMIATAESCTGGLVAALLTEVPGSSVVFERGFVTYSNQAKNEAIGVPLATLETHGAVSEETAKAMAMGALGASHADLAISITGIAGPGGGTPEKPVGLVHIAVAGPAQTLIHSEQRYGSQDRDTIRSQTVIDSITLAAKLLRNLPGKIAC